jgi:hypothetical protein
LPGSPNQQADAGPHPFREHPVVSEALIKRLRAFQQDVNEITKEAPVDEFTKAQTEYRAAREEIDLYAEALKARPYIAQLEQKLAEAENLLRERARPHGW